MMSKRGRPTREPTEAEREKVRELAKNGSPVSDIAKLPRRSVPNLRKYFSLELFAEKKTKADAVDDPFNVTAPRATIPRGGKRPGAGRTKGLRTYSGRPLTDLVAAMLRLDATLALPARVAFALRLLGADEREIAAVLQISTGQVVEFFGKQVAQADDCRRCALLKAIDRAPAGGDGRPPNATACMYLLRRIDRNAPSRAGQEGQHP